MENEFALRLSFKLSAEDVLRNGYLTPVDLAARFRRRSPRLVVLANLPLFHNAPLYRTMLVENGYRLAANVNRAEIYSRESALE